MGIKEQKILVNRLNINCKTIGEGKPFLILHGWGSSSDKWIQVANILSQKGLKIIIVDLPGFGKSEKPKTPWDLDNYTDFLSNFIKTAGFGKVIIAGHSFGGGLAVKYAIRNPKNIAKLFLIASACIRRDSIKKKIFRAVSKILKTFSFIPGYDLFRRAFYKFIVRKSDYQYTNGVMKETYLNVINEDLSPLLFDIKNETIIIWGNKDNVLPIEQAKEMNGMIFGSKLIIIDKADHNLEQKMAGALSAKILENI